MRTRLALPLVVLHALSGVAWACPACFGQTQGPLLDAARLGIWLLLAVVFAVQAAFVAFFLHLRRQSRRAADQALDEEWSLLVLGACEGPESLAAALDDHDPFAFRFDQSGSPRQLRCGYAFALRSTPIDGFQQHPVHPDEPSPSHL